MQIANHESAGAGNSTRPDGLVEAQVQSHVETAHQLIQQLRSGSIGRKKWGHIVSAGFSIGSATLNSLVDQYPEDADAIILYGFTHNALWVYPGFLAGLQASANQIDPDKWGDIPSTYQSTSTLESRVVACYAGNYDREQLVYDHEHRDFDSLGAAITLVLHMLDAPEYKGHVMLANGDGRSIHHSSTPPPLPSISLSPVYSICSTANNVFVFIFETGVLLIILIHKRMLLSVVFTAGTALRLPTITFQRQPATISRFTPTLAIKCYSTTQVLSSCKMLSNS